MAATAPSATANAADTINNSDRSLLPAIAAL
jgi:hypothetical protein